MRKFLLGTTSLICVSGIVGCGSSGSENASGAAAGGSGSSGSADAQGGGLLGAGGKGGTSGATDAVPCTDDNECQNDTYCGCESSGGGGADGGCSDGHCISYGTAPRGLFDPECRGEGFLASEFQAPVLHCQWSDPGWEMLMATPLVVDLDGDGEPEILFTPQQHYTGAQKLVAIRGGDCSEVFSVGPVMSWGPQIAVADLDGDGLPEIVGFDEAEHVLVFNNVGTLVATSPTSFNTNTATTQVRYSAPAIANIDGIGPPEIAVAGQVLRYNKGQSTLEVLWTQPFSGPLWGAIDVVADLDADGTAEVILGSQIFDGLTGAEKTPSALTLASPQGTFPAVADFNGDKHPDLVLVPSMPGQPVLIFDFTNSTVLFGPYYPGGHGGAPTVADFDGDGAPDFGFASENHYSVYALKCANLPKPADCLGTREGVLWDKKIQDGTSGVTGSSVFDFNGDGRAEVVYRDECWLRAYDGSNGDVLFATTVTSGTAFEYPVIADVDADGHADIVVGADNQGAWCPTGPESDTGALWGGETSGIHVFKDPLNRWMPSRSLWNQHAYHITNINDDGTVPLVEANNWETWNNYRQNVQGVLGQGAAQVDLTAGYADGQGSTPDCSAERILTAEVCNRGASSVGVGVSGAFYVGDPRAGGTLICSTQTTKALAPGECEAVSCSWMDAPKSAVDVWFAADDAGALLGEAGETMECKEGNNLLHMPQAACDVGAPPAK